ncbi:MFS transporter [Streptomyces sp. NPDC029554]|uniref:MFS transporter n=1 Tax=Streptomyces sp. NPDC029554 TaxID=3155126 RepID=UPI0033E44A64
MSVAGRVAKGPPARTDGQEGEPSPFRDRRFLIFAAGNIVNNLGEALYVVALPLLAYHRTGSLGVMALLAAAAPAAALLSPALGQVADRRGVRELVLYGLLLQAGAATVMNLLLLRHGTATWGLFLSAFLVAVGGAAYRTGWITGVAATFPASPVRARGTLNSMYLATTMAGPVIAAALLPYLGYLGLLWLNLPTFFVPLAVWALGVHPPAVASPRIRQRMWEQWRPALHAIFRDPRMRTLLVIQLVTDVACGAGLTSLLMYHLAHGWRLDGEAVGLLLGAVNLSGLLGNVYVSQRRVFRAWRWLAVGMALRAATLALLAVPAWPVFLCALVLGQFGGGMVTAAVVMGRVKFLPPEVLGRASGVLWLLSGGAGLLSSTTVLLLDDALGLLPTYLVLGAAASVGVWCLLRTRRAWSRS